MSHTYNTIIIGGGVTGLCAAYYAMKRHGQDAVLLLEGSPHFGGTARTQSFDGVTCEMGPNGFLDKEPKTLQWVADLGLESEMIRANTAAERRFIYRNGSLHELKPPPAFLASKVLSLQGRIRLAMEPLIAQRVSEEEESIWDFAARRIGSEAADTLVAPMVSGIYGGDAKQLHLASCFPKMASMEAEYGGLFKAMMAKKRQKATGGGSAMGPGGTLTSFTGGMSTLVNRVVEELGSAAKADSPVNRIEKHDEGFSVTTEAGETFRSAKVIVAAPVYAAASMVENFDADLSSTLSEIPFASMTVLCSLYNREDVGHNLDGFGFLIPRTQQKRILGCIWTSTLFPGRAPEGKVLLRTMIGGATDPDAINLRDDELLDVLRAELFPMLGINADPTMLRIFRWKKAIPQYTLGHQARLKRIEAAEQRHPGLHFAGNAYRGVGLNDCVLSALRSVGEEEA